MTIIIGRLTQDAQVRTIDEGKTVVNFTIAINDYYKPKDATEAIEYTEFVQCAYWYNSGIATSLKKGAVVEAGGRLFATAYVAGQEIRPQINLQVQHVKIHVFARSTGGEDGDNSNVNAGAEVQTGAKPQAGNGKNRNKRKQYKNGPAKHTAAQKQEMEGLEPTGDLPF